MVASSVAEEFLVRAQERARVDPLRVSIRELLGQWGYHRRGYWIVQLIRQELEERGLTTEPELEAGWIDNEVEIVPLASHEQQIPQADAQDQKTSSSAEVGLRVSSLRSANTSVISVSPHDSLCHAQSLMMRYEYSQLPVLSGKREERGAVTWESIARAVLRSADATLADATVPVHVVQSEDELLPVIARIVDRGFVLVRARDRTFSGVVTLADISEEFVTLAGPFFLLGEIERRLRKAIDRCFDLKVIQEVVDPGSRREVKGAEDLTIGEYIRLLESPDRWAQTGWQSDRVVFLEALEAVREVRNDIMHFSPDPIEQDRLDHMHAFLKWLRVLEP